MENEPIIRFQDFGFQYTAQAEPTLYHINLDIHKGEKVLIAGPSGRGNPLWPTASTVLCPIPIPENLPAA